jgi:hypothetical protein
MFPSAARRVAAWLLCAGACLLLQQARAAVGYYFQWYCTGCIGLGTGSNGREGPFASAGECQNARNSMAANLSIRGCGMQCFTPQLCLAEGAAEPPSIARPPAAVAPPPAAAVPAYGTGEKRRAEQSRQERAQAARESESRGVAGPPKAAPGLAPAWRNAVSRYQVRASGGAIEIVLAETCASSDCAFKNRPDRTVFRGKLDQDRLVGVIVIRSPVEVTQNGNRCSTPAGEFPIEGRISADGGRITWGDADLPAQPGCRPALLSLGVWERDPQTPPATR